MKLTNRFICIFVAGLGLSSLLLAQDITRAEYFFDTDPGFGQAQTINVPTPGNELSLDFTLDTEELSDGIHRLFIRTMDDLGRWSITTRSTLLRIDLPTTEELKITAVEYFIDTDPGYGLGTPVSLSESSGELDLSFSVQLDGLEDGDHTLFVRAGKQAGTWGHVFAQSFNLEATSSGEQIVQTHFKLYPNPSAGSITLEWDATDDETRQIRIIDMKGRICHETQCKASPCTIRPELTSGTYLLQVKGAGKEFSSRIVIH